MMAPLSAFTLAAMVLLHVAVAAPPAKFTQECLTPAMTSQFGAFPNAFQAISSTSDAVVGPISTKVTVAENFALTYFDTYKLVTNTQLQLSYALYPCGLSPPASSLLPVGTRVFPVPLTSVTVTDATVLGFLDLLGVLDRVSHVTQYAVNNCMQKLSLGCNQLPPDETTNSTAALALQLSTVDAFITGNIYDTDNPLLIVATASADPGPLNRAEWIKFFATLFNKEDIANQKFAGISQRYAATKAAVTAVAANRTRTPVVAWLLYSPAYTSQIYNSSASWEIQFPQYKVILTEDAGGRMLTSTFLQGFVTTSTDDVILSGSNNVRNVASATKLRLTNSTTFADTLRLVMADVDVVIDESAYSDVTNQEVTLDYFMNMWGFNKTNDKSTFKFLKNSQVLREDLVTNPAGFTAWFEGGVAQPDKVLADLAATVSLGSVSINSNPTFLRTLGTEAVNVLQASTCAALQSCAFTITPICPLIYKACNGTIVAATTDARCAPSCPITSASWIAVARPFFVLAVAAFAVLSCMLLA